MRTWVALFALLPLAGFAQEWRAEAKVTGSARASYSHSGNFVGYDTRDPEGEWLASELYHLPEHRGVACAEQPELELDHYHGLDEGYSVNVFATLKRSGKGWRVEDPAIFFSLVDENDESFSDYEGYDRTKVLLVDLVCKNDNTALVELAYSGVIDRYGGTGDPQISITGRATFTARILEQDF